MEALWSDVQYVLRGFRHAPGLVMVVAFTLSLGLGASTAIFSVIESVLMEPFPYPDAERFMFMQIHDIQRNEPGGRGTFNGPEFLNYVEQNHVFDRVIATDFLDVLYRSPEGTERFAGVYVTPGTFEFLGMPAQLGRVVQPADYEPGAPPVFVLRYKTWVSRFGADSGVLNKTLVLNGVPRTLVGIMPARFGWGDADVWIPAKPSRTLATSLADADKRTWFLLGHLKPGVVVKQAEADLTLVARGLAQLYPKDYPKEFSVELSSLTDLVVGKFRTTLLVVLAAVGLLLLVACGNVANLLLARAATREKEFAIRSALGASRWRLIRQLLVESMLLSVIGGTLGIVLAWAGLRTLVDLMPQETIPAETVIGLNVRVLLFTLGVGTLTAVLSGLLPALSATRRDLNEPLRGSGKGMSGTVRHRPLRDWVVVSEVGFSLTLVVAAGLLMKSFGALRETKLGLQTDHVLAARIPLPLERYHTADQVAGFFRPLLKRLNELPGIVDASETSSLPPDPGIPSNIELLGKTHFEKWTAQFQLCSQEYFPVLKIQFLAGRAFTEAEVTGKRKLAVINATFAKKYLQDENPISKHVSIAELAGDDDTVSPPIFEIIGVVADVKNQGLQNPVEPEIWVPYTVTGSSLRGILVRTAREPSTMTDSVRREIWATDSNVAVTMTGTLDDYINQISYAGPRFVSFVVAIFGGIALVLATVGVYSVLAHTIASRVQEIGIRMALGATRSDIMAMVVAMGLRLVGIGLGIGLITSLAFGRLIATQLWRVSAYDPWTLATVSILFLITGLLACWRPAQRAASVDPLVALRYEQ